MCIENHHIKAELAAMEDIDAFFRNFSELIVDGDRIGIELIYDEMPFNRILQPHRHEYYELRFRLASDEDAPTRVEIIYPRVCHYMLTLEDHDRTHIWTLSPDTPEFHHRMDCRGDLSTEFLPQITQLLERLRRCREPDAEKELRLLLALMSLRRPTPIPGKMDSYEKIHLLMKNLRAHYYRPNLSIAREAAAIGYSPNYVQKKFFKVANSSPKDFLKTVRMDAAAKFLREQRYPLKQIALMCGYKYLPYFSRVFRAYYGCTPGKFVRLFAEQSVGKGKNA